MGFEIFKIVRGPRSFINLIVAGVMPRILGKLPVICLLAFLSILGDLVEKITSC